MGDRYTVLVTDKNLVYLGDPIVDWIQLDVALRLNEPSSGFFTAPAYPWIREQVVPGCRIVVVRHTDDGLGAGIIIAGPMEKRMFERSDDGENAGIGKITVHFADDWARIAARDVYPDPAVTAEAQVIDSWSYTGNAELGIRSLVDGNAGPSALVPRRIPTLALDTVSGVGTSITVAADRMQPLGEVAREMALVGGGLVFSTRQVGSQILFAVTEPLDVSGDVRFSFAFGNLKYIGYELVAPTATTVFVGGQGEGADRALIERSNSAEETVWGRYEVLESQPGNDPLDQLEAAGDRALGDGAATVRIASSVVDGDQQRFGVTYNIGYKVAVENEPGEQIIDIVRTVHIQAWATAGSLISAFVGSQSANPSPMWQQRMQKAEERLGRLERRVKPAVP